MCVSIPLAIILTGLFLGETMSEPSSPAPSNAVLLDKAKSRMKEFESNPEAEFLREASIALDNVNQLLEHDAKVRAQLRADCLSAWLRLLAILDRSIDPKFDPKDLPETRVQAPADLNDNPKARAEFEKANAANRAKADY